MRDLIEKLFNESLDELFNDRYPEVKKAIQQDGHKQKLFDNMTREMRLIEKKGKNKLTRAKIKMFVDDYVKLFGQVSIKSKEDELGIKKSKSRVFLPPVKKPICVRRGSIMGGLPRGTKVTKSGIILP